MASERKARRVLQETPRKKLANITNISNNSELRNVLAEKDSTIQAQAALIEKLELVLEQKTAQNEEIIGHYYRQYKELEQARQELKILQHDYTQMSTVYRLCKSELQAKLDEANERVNVLLAQRDNRDEESHRQRPPSRRKSRRVSGSVVKRVVRDTPKLNIPSIPEGSPTSSPAATVSKRQRVAEQRSSPQPPPPAPSVPRQRASGRPMRKATETVTSYKEPPLNTKMRRSY